MSDQPTVTFEGYGILELFGHRRLAGFISESDIAGQRFLRVETISQGLPATQFYAPSAVYSLTPTTEEIAREIGCDESRPISLWDIQHIRPAARIQELPVIEPEAEAEPANSDVYYPY